MKNPIQLYDENDPEVYKGRPKEIKGSLIGSEESCKDLYFVDEYFVKK